MYQHLVDDILLIIFGNLNLKCLVNIKSVCKRWKNLILSNYQDESIYKIDFIVDRREQNRIMVESELIDNNFLVKFGDVNLCDDQDGFEEETKIIINDFHSLINNFDQNKTKINQKVKIDFMTINYHCHKCYAGSYERFAINDGYFRYTSEDKSIDCLKIKIKKNEINILRLLIKIYRIAAFGYESTQK